MSRLMGNMSLIWLVLAISSVAAQNPAVVDTDGNPVQTGVGYYVLPGVTDVAGGLTLVNRNNSCPLYVGQEPLAETVSQGYLVTFQPFVEGETIIREQNSFTATFSSVSSICIQSTTWNVGERDTETNRRLIFAGPVERYSSYFKIDNNNGVYNFNWCPSDVCPTCRFDCGSVGILIENEMRLLALDGSGPAFPFEFRKA